MYRSLLTRCGVSPLNNRPLVSLDKEKLDVGRIHDFLSNKSYWAKGRTLEQVRVSIDKSICFGVYLKGEHVAFARVVSDTVAFAYLLDVIVFEEHQGQGFGSLLVDTIMKHHEFKTVSWLLRTIDAQGLYQKFGFAIVDSLDNCMRRPAGGNY